MYKLGFTSMSSVHERLACQGTGDEHLLDETLLFCFHQQAFDLEQRLHGYFAGKSAFGAFSSDPYLPLYKNGQSELYVDDILGLDDAFTEVRARRTRASLERIPGHPRYEGCHWSLVLLLTLLMGLAKFLGAVLRGIESVFDVLRRVDPKARGKIFGKAPGSGPSYLDAMNDREIGPVLAWAHANRADARMRQQGGMEAVRTVDRPPARHDASLAGAAASSSPGNRSAAGNSVANSTRPVGEPEPSLPPRRDATAATPHAAAVGAADAVTCPRVALLSGASLPSEELHVPCAEASVCDREPGSSGVGLEWPETGHNPLIDGDGLETFDASHRHFHRAGGDVQDCIEEAALLALAEPDESLLWDGIFWDRDDWIEQALAFGVNPDSVYYEELPAVQAAAYLNRSRAVELLAHYGAGYPVMKIRGSAPYLNSTVYDFPEPATCAIFHDNLPMLRTLLAMPSHCHSCWSNDTLTDYGWSDAVAHAKNGRYGYLLEIIMSNLRKGVPDGQSELATWIAANATRFGEAMRLLLSRLKNGDKARPTMHFLPRPGGDGIASMNPDICAIGLRCADYLCSFDREDRASAALETLSFVLVDASPWLSFRRTRLNDTTLAEIVQVSQSGFEGDFHYADIALFTAPSTSDMDAFVQTRVDVQRMARFAAALLEKDFQAAAVEYKLGVNLDVPLRTTKNFFNDYSHRPYLLDAATAIEKMNAPEEEDHY